MVRIYTKKGDDGTTSLWYGGRKPKSDARIEAYGAVDEAGSALGVARSLCGPDDAELHADVLRLQNELFVCGAELATAPEAAERLRRATRPDWLWRKVGPAALDLFLLVEHDLRDAARTARNSSSRGESLSR